MWTVTARGSDKCWLRPVHTTVGSITVLVKTALLVNITVSKPHCRSTTHLGKEVLLIIVCKLREPTDCFPYWGVRLQHWWDFPGIAPSVRALRAQTVPEELEREIMGNCVLRDSLFLLETLLPLSCFDYECRDEVIVLQSMTEVRKRGVEPPGGESKGQLAVFEVELVISVKMKITQEERREGASSR